MDPGDAIQLVALVILIGLSAFFSSAETALTTVNKIRIQVLAEEGNKRAVTLLKVIDDPGKMLSTLLVGNNIVNNSVTSIATALTIKLFYEGAIGFSTLLITLIILIFGEITPKTIATIYSEKLSLAYATIIYRIMLVLNPVVFFVTKLSNAVLHLLRIDPYAKMNTMTESELRTIVNVSHEEGVIESEERQMIHNVFDFGDSQAKDVMVPRIDVTFVNVDSTYSELIELFREDKFTRLPVYEDTTDHIIGIINMKDLLLLDSLENFSIRNILRKAYFTFEYKKTSELLMEMRKDSINFAIVLDEYGSMAGLITLEDLLEEIVGEIRDEYDDQEEEDITEIRSQQEYLLLGSAKLDDINEQLHLQLESEDYDSIGGYVIETLDRFPEPEETVLVNSGVRLVVDKIEKNRIELVHLYLTEQQEEPAKDERKN
ncbi:MAG: HlyC/CorC family transporter [Lachnospiraceae bacterium]